MGDIRVLKTKENIMNSFFDLLDSEKYQYITVEQLCQYARCSRSTFYAHYDSKESLLQEIIDGYMNRYSNYAKRRFKSGIDFKILLLTLMNEFIIPEKENIYKLFQINSGEKGFQNRFEDFCKKIFIMNYLHIPSGNIIAELYSACVIKVLKAIIEGQLREDDIKILDGIQNNLLKLISV